MSDNTTDRGPDDRVTALSSTETLVEATGRGSRLALKLLYDRESRRLYGMALGMVPRPDGAADVLHEAFIQVWQSARSYIPERGAAEDWLTGILRLCALDAVRKAGGEPVSGDALSEPPADPPAGAWDRISVQVSSAAQTTRLPSWWNKPAPWRWATTSLALATALLLLVVARPPTGPHYVAVLGAPGQQTPGFIVMGGHREIVAHAVYGAAPPADRTFELWAIYPDVSRPQAMGVIPANGMLRVKDFPTEILAGASFVVSVEPSGGSPTGQPTGAVVYTGKLRQFK